MSIDLSITMKGRGSLCLSELVQETRQELQSLLQINEVPEITVVELDRGKRSPLGSDEIPNDCLLLFGMNDRDWILEFLLQHNGIHPRAGALTPTATVSVRASGRDPEKSALAAALTIATATLTDGTILDDYKVWVAKDELQTDEFRRALASEHTAESFEDAAERFVTRMNKCPTAPR